MRTIIVIPYGSNAACHAARGHRDVPDRGARRDVSQKVRPRRAALRGGLGDRDGCRRFRGSRNLARRGRRPAEMGSVAGAGRRSARHFHGDLHAEGRQAPAARHRREAGSGGRADRPSSMARGVPVRRTHGDPGGDGDGLHHRIPLSPDRHRALRVGRLRRARRGGRLGVGLGTLWPARQPRAVLQGNVCLPVLFALQLVIYSFHEATEANLLPLDNAYWHVATEPYGPEGQYGALLTYLLVLVPAAWLVFAALKTRLARVSPG